VAADSFIAAVSSESWLHVNWSSSRGAAVAATSCSADEVATALLAGALHSLTDADLLPEVFPGFTPPFRLCPPHARAKLVNDELTYLRKLAHPLPTHFVLGITLPTVICQFFPRKI
jgi:hypothetical protein